MENTLIGIKEASILLGVSIDTLRRWDKSGRLKAIRFGSRTHRLYNYRDIELALSQKKRIKNIAKKWVSSNRGFALDAQLHCKTRDVFQARLEKFQSVLSKSSLSSDLASLIVAVVGEIGNNSFDHNLGNWSDDIGIFFHYDKEEKKVILADRGQGIEKTLKRVKPEVTDSKSALQVAFTQVVSGRYPEARGNGLKFVRSIITSNPLSLDFQTGNASLHLQENNRELGIQKVSPIKGCFARIVINA